MVRKQVQSIITGLKGHNQGSVTKKTTWLNVKAWGYMCNRNIFWLTEDILDKKIFLLKNISGDYNYIQSVKEKHKLLVEKSSKGH